MIVSKKNISLTIFFVAALLFGCSSLVNAEKDSTGVTIKITKPELYIESVNSPVFGTYTTSDKLEEVTADSDLVIKVIDKRNTSSGWQLKYSLSMFEQENKQEFQDGIDYTISKGVLTADQKEVSSDIVDISDVNQETNGKDIVSLKESSASNYDYRVLGKNIKLSLPKNLAVGKYVAVQTITLEDLPSTIE